MNTKAYAVVIERGPTSVGAYVPDLPGCVTVARTVPQVEKLIATAIEMHVAGLREDGLPVPKPRTEIGMVPVGRSRPGDDLKAEGFVTIDDLIRDEVMKQTDGGTSSTAYRKKSAAGRRASARKASSGDGRKKRSS